MRVVPAGEMRDLSGAVPAEAGQLVPSWLEGPFNGDRLDVGVVVCSSDGAAPPHIHIGGQVIVVLGGRGFVEAGGERVELQTGDVVISPPGELHTHGALSDSAFAHLTVTTRGYEFPTE